MYFISFDKIRFVNFLPNRSRFTVLCQELIDAFKRDAAQRGVPRLLLTAAVAAGYKTIDAGYEIAKVGRLLDFINLMAYDLHGTWDKKTGHHTAMVGDDKLTVPYAVDYWLKGGMPAKKIALGMGTYGRAFTLDNTTNNGLGASAKKAGPRGKYTREAGFLAYYEICSKQGLTVVQNNAVGAPYGYIGEEWYGFDNKQSLTQKVNKLIKGKNLLGAMFWALDLDDFKGTMCNQGPYPLMNHVKKLLGGYTPPPPVTEEPLPPTQKPPPTQAPPTQAPPTQPPSGVCRGVPGSEHLNAWCKDNCAAGYCPATHCTCA